MLQWVRDLRPLVQDQLLYAGELSLGEKEIFHDVLHNILVPRTVGSQGHRKVRQVCTQDQVTVLAAFDYFGCTASV